MQQFFTALLGPMFAKEMLEISRRRRYFFNRVLYGVVLLCAVFLVWESNWYRWNHNFSIAAAAAIASELFTAVVCVQYGAVFLFVPVFVAGVIASEREAHTLDLLLTTQLSDREIVLGKLGSRLAVAGILVLCAVPVLSLIGLFGGVDPGAVVRTQSATLLAMLYCGAHAAYFSTTTRSPMGALIRTYWWMALWMLAMPVFVSGAVYGLVKTSQPVEQVMLPALMAINPGAALVVGVVPEAHRDMIRWVGPWYFPALVVVPTLWSLFLLVMSVKKLRVAPATGKRRVAKLVKALAYSPPSLLQDDTAVPATDDQTVNLRAARASLWLGNFAVENPFWLRSRLAKVYDRDGHIRRIEWGAWCLTAAFVLLVALASDRSAWGDDDLATVFITPIWIAVAALTAIVSASGLISDRRRGFFELALVTDLTPAEIVWGTLGAVWEHVKLIYFLAWGTSVFFILTGTANPLGMFLSVITATLNCGLLLIMGTLCSLSARTVSAALLVTFALPAVMVVAVPMSMVFRQDAGPVVWCICIAYVVAAISWARHSSSTAAVGNLLIAVHLALVALATFWTHMHRSQDEYPVVVMNPAIMTVISLFENDFQQLPHRLLLYSLYWLAILISGAVGIRLMIKRFDELVERSSSKARELPASAPPNKSSILEPSAS